ncbi:MAG: hypothetical protein MAG581_01691 [Deltaproteobacteria bacterium]|jgi:hypothetical protein|nr:hypothetical protein [Deltaproteobacteria bacterium]
MKLISLAISLLTGFAINLMAVPAAPFLITFAQPDGSTFQAHLKGDEYFSWIETENKMILVKSKTSGYFEFALINRDANNRLILVPSGIPVIQSGQSTLRTEHNIPKITREQLGKIWQSRIDERRNVKLVPANE